MRRAAPWALLGVLALGTAAGAALGITQRASVPVPSAQEWVAGVLAATERAGTARFAYTHVTTSPNPDLRATLTGSVVDAVVVGGVQYQRNAIPGLGFTDRYVELPLLLPPRSQRGLQLALNASVAVDPLTGPQRVAAVHDLGPAMVDGTAATEYRVLYAPVTTCAPRRATPLVVTRPPSILWVDGRGRLVRVRSTYRFSGLPPKGVTRPAALDGFPQGPTTTTATLTFTAFGMPVHITAPPSSALVPHGRSSTGSARFTIDAGCHS